MTTCTTNVISIKVTDIMISVDSIYTVSLGLCLDISELTVPILIPRGPRGSLSERAYRRSGGDTPNYVDSVQ